jgi:hypothetical protein
LQESLACFLATAIDSQITAKHQSKKVGNKGAVPFFAQAVGIKEIPKRLNAMLLARSTRLMREAMPVCIQN